MANLLWSTFHYPGPVLRLDQQIRTQLRKSHIKVSLPAMLELEVFHYLGPVLQITTVLRKVHIQVSLFLRYNKYFLYSARITSFNKWPKSMPITAKELAHAGFIYTGWQGTLSLVQYVLPYTSSKQETAHSKNASNTVKDVITFWWLCLTSSWT